MKHSFIENCIVPRKLTTLNKLVFYDPLLDVLMLNEKPFVHTSDSILLMATKTEANVEEDDE